MGDIKKITDPSFSQYAVIHTGYDLTDLILAAKKIPMPQSGGVAYRASIPELEATKAFESLKAVYAGEQAIQCGLCWGQNEYLGGVEYHRSSEINIAVTDMVAVFGDRRDIVDFTYDSAKSNAYYVPQGTMFEMYATTLHLAPCSALREGFYTIVVLPRGTNNPLSKEGAARAKAAAGEDRALFAVDKWFYVFPGSDAEKGGAYGGMRGEDRRIAGF
ncbi:MAG: DUF4867 family protein [Clostridiales bacterium]|jgi:hypothetical protein|nr:DUF4867 family protein [Clostridiales bacterium]